MMGSPLSVPAPAWRDEEAVQFADSVDRWLKDNAPPAANERWREQGMVDRDLWNRAGEAGLLCLSAPEQHGGMGGDYRHEVVLMEQLGRHGSDSWGVSLHNAIVAPYVTHYGTEDQKRRWLPKLASGEYVGAIAMTEPGAGSDLQGIKTTARMDGNELVVNGSKTFITNGQQANFIIVVAKTDPTAGAKGTSLVVVEADGAEGFRRGRNLDKIGMEGNDTSELFFDDVRVPPENLIGGEPGRGFYQLMEQLPQERLNIAVQGLAVIEAALAYTLEYVKGRNAFGKAVIEFQNTQFVLAECKTEATIARVFVDHCIERHLKGELDQATASMAKYWVTDLQNSLVDRCLQLFGGYGYMNEYPIARMWKDARVQRIYGGTNEIMKVLIARTL